MKIIVDMLCGGELRFSARWEGHAVSGYGNSRNEAVGSLIRNYPHIPGIMIEERDPQGNVIKLIGKQE